MRLVYTAGVFTFFFFFFFWFQLKDFETDETKRRIKKTKEEIFNNVKDSIMIEEIVNKDFEKRRTV